MFTAAYSNLKKLYPKSHFYLLSYYPKADRRIVSDTDITILDGGPLRLLAVTMPLSIFYWCFHKLRFPTSICTKDSVLHYIEKADLFLDVGGVTFSDGRKIYLPFNLITILPGLLLNKPVVKLAQAMGPFNSRLNRICAAIVLPKLKKIYARGELTAKHLKSLKLKNSSTAADLSFAVPYRGWNHKKIVENYHFNSMAVGIAPSSVVYKYCNTIGIDYVQIIADFSEYLMERWQHHLVLIPYSLRLDTMKLKNNDLPIVHKIMSSIKSSQKPTVIEEELNSSELKFVMQQFEFFIGSRFHSMVSALSLSLPLIVCGWGHKYLEVLKQFDMEMFAVDYQNLSLEVLKSKFEILTNNKE